MKSCPQSSIYIQSFKFIMFGVKNRTKNQKNLNDIYDTPYNLRVMLKLSGFFPLKIEETSTGKKAVICKYGVLCTVFHLTVFLSAVIHFTLLSDEKLISLNYGKIGDYGYVALIVLEGITSLILFSSVFTIKKHENRIIFYTSEIDRLCHQLQIDNSAVFRRSRVAVGALIVMLVVLVTAGSAIFVHTQATAMHGVPPIDMMILGILPHLYINIKINSFLIYVLALNSGLSRFYKLMESFSK